MSNDPIREAVVELRFESENSRQLPEMVVGQIISNEAWSDYNKERLPIFDVPSSIRAADPAFKYKPLMELTDKDSGKKIKVGPNVISFHCYEPYIGWSKFAPFIAESVSQLFGLIASVVINRVGIRYVNFLNSEEHYCKSVNDLKYSINYEGSDLLEPQNLNFKKKIEDGITAFVRIASAELVVGQNEGQISAMIDIDVFTSSEIQVETAEKVMDIVEKFHVEEKRVFSSLIPDELRDELEGLS